MNRFSRFGLIGVYPTHLSGYTHAIYDAFVSG
jgi:hypothetical protein